MEKIRSEDIFLSPTEAVLAYLTSQYDDAAIQELLRSGANSVQSLLVASLATAPAERQAAMIEIVNSVGTGIKPGKTDRR
jgi:hypothetical protein